MKTTLARDKINNHCSTLKKNFSPMKKSFLFLLSVLFALAITAVSCTRVAGNQTTNTMPRGDTDVTENQYQGVLVLIAQSRGFSIVYDAETLVMYAYHYGGYSRTLTPLYNADGTLKLYKGSGDGGVGY